MNEVGEWEDSAWQWKIRWRRARFEWEVPLEADLTHQISQVSLSRERKDVQIWGGEDTGVFSVNSAYRYLTKQTRNSQQEVFISLWKTKALPNVITTAWRALLGRLPTRVNLRRRGGLLSSTICVFCHTKEETCQHIFLECEFAQKVWTLCFKWIGVQFVQHKDLLIHFENFSLPQLNCKQNLLWKGVWATIMRCIWEHRNSNVFKQGVVDVEEIFQMVQLKMWQWLKHMSQSFNYSFADWILNPLICCRSFK